MNNKLSLKLHSAKNSFNAGKRHGVDAYGIANFASPHLVPTMKAIVKEVAAMFPDELFFFGGDETACPYNECDYACVISLFLSSFSFLHPLGYKNFHCTQL